MSWVRLDDQIAMHPKVLAAGDAAFGGWVRLLAYCAAYLTDGAVPVVVATAMVGSETIDKLVAAGLMDQSPEGLLSIHGYLDWNPPASEVREKRAAAAVAKSEAGRRGGLASGETRAKQKRSRIEAETQAETKQEPSRNEAEAQAKTKRNEAPSPFPYREGEGDAGQTEKPSPLTEAIEILKSHGLKRDVVASIKDIWPSRESLPDALRCVLDTAPSTITAGYVVSQIRKLADAPEVLEDYRRQKTVRRPVAQEWG
ncbi:MAG: hypothetical protein ACRC4O_14665 [Giesbergeria sp.]